MNRIDTIIQDIQQGKPILIVDSPDREGEIDAFVAAEKATPTTLSFLISKCRGLMCVTLKRSRITELGIPPVPTNGKDKFSTAFQCPVDAAEGVSTGMSVNDRMVTLSLLVDQNTKPEQLSYPGHLQILASREGGFAERRGHTESSIFCCQIAKVQPVGVIVEIIKDDGSMARAADVEQYSEDWGMNWISVEELCLHDMIINRINWMDCETYVR